MDAQSSATLEKQSQTTGISKSESGKPKRLLSFIFPAFNEEGNLKKLHEVVTLKLKSMPDNYEIIFIDDGSTDNSYAEMCEIQQLDSYVRVIKFRRNFGKAAAYNAGFSHARGDVVVTMDADMQDDPEDLPNMLAKLDEGYDMVNGWKHEGKGPMGKSLPSKLFNKVISSVTRIKLNDFNCPFKVYKKEVLKEIDLYGSLHRFIPVLAHTKGFTIAEVKIKNLPRLHGVSKYGIGRFQRGLLDTLTVIFITRFGKRPLHFLGIGGLFIGAIGSAIIGTLVGAHFLYKFNFLTDSSWNLHDRPIFNLGVLMIYCRHPVFLHGIIGGIICDFD